MVHALSHPERRASVSYRQIAGLRVFTWLGGFLLALRLRIICH